MAQPLTVPASSGSGKTFGVIVILVLILLGIGGWFFMTHRAVAATPPASAAATQVTSTTVTQATTSAASTATAGVPPAAEATSSASSALTGTAADAATELAAGSKQCSLITREEMGALLGAKIVKVISTELTCSYFTDADRSAQVEPTWVNGRAALAETKRFNQGLLTPVPGIGDEAYMQAAGVLHVLKGDTYIVINSREYPNQDEIEPAIAKKILEKMK